MRSKKKSDVALREHCLDFDIFGRQIKLTFDGKDKVRTRFGTICTVIIAVIILTYITFHVPDIWDYRNALPVISPMPRRVFTELYQRDYMNLLDRNSEPYHGDLENAVKPGTFFAFGLGYEKRVDPRLGEFVVE